MKNFAFYSLATCLLLVSFTSCNSDSEGASEEEVTIPGAELGSDFIRDHGIHADTGLMELEAYKEFLDTVIADLKAFDPDKYGNVEEKLVYGAKLDFKVLAELLTTREEARGVFIMSGLKDNVADMIFGVRHGIENPVMEYFDFTQPCPSACPPLDMYNMQSDF